MTLPYTLKHNSNVGVVGATLPVGFSMPVIDWLSLVCKDFVWWVIGMTLPKFINVNFLGSG